MTTHRQFPKPSRIFLFGGSQLLYHLAKWLVHKDYAITIYTSPRQEREPMLGTTLGGLLKSVDLFYSSVEELPDQMELEVGKDDMGFGLGQAWGFSKDVVAAFNGSLIDVMAIPLPWYLGRAHFSHMILRKDRTMGLNLQEITVNTVQGECHDGAVYASTRFAIPEGSRIPQQYFDHLDLMALPFLRDFLLGVEAGHTFFGQPIDMDNSITLPGLKTDMHSWINWDMRGYDLETFICAFDSPYAGALSRINGHVVHLKDCWLQKDLAFHPFHSGIVTRITKDGVYVATTSGHLLVKSVTCGEHNAIPWISAGDRFVSEPKDLDEARYKKAEFYSK